MTQPPTHPPEHEESFVLDEVSAGSVRSLGLTVQRGACVGVAASSGEASTLVEVATGLRAPRSGRVTVGGIPVQAGKVGAVMSPRGLYDARSARDNLAFPLAVRGFAESVISPRIKELAELLDLGSILTRLASGLTADERFRVALARALAPEPSAVVIDKPMEDAGSNRSRAARRAAIRAVQRSEPVAILVVTEELAAASPVLDEGVVVADGRVRQRATPAELREAPADLEVAQRVFDPPMVFFSCQRRGRSLEGPAFEAAAPRDWTKGRCVVGVRPTDFRLPAPAEERRPSIRCLVDAVEHVGGERRVRLQCGAGIVDIPERWLGSSSITEGDELELTVDPDRLCHFDEETGRRA